MSADRLMTPAEALRAIARLRRIEHAAKEWARCQRGAYPTTRMGERDGPGAGSVSQSEMRRAEIALLAAIEDGGGV